MALSAEKRLHGCYIANLTPFAPNGSVDLDVVKAHTNWMIECGVEGLCPAGTTGEFLFLTTAEKTAIIKANVEAAAGRVPVVAGVWGFSVEEVQELTRGAAENGAVAVFLPPPIYYPAGDEAIEAWYRAAAAASDLPVYAYNIPQYAANTVSFECLDRLTAEGVIAGAKDSTGKKDRVSELVNRYGEKYTIFAASDGFASEGRKIGADGFISAIGNAAPELFAKLWAGDDSLQPKVDSIRTALKSVGSSPALKYLLTLRGFAFGGSRIPCSELTASQRTMLQQLSSELD